MSVPGTKFQVPTVALSSEGEAEALARRLADAYAARVKHAQLRERVRGIQLEGTDPYPDEPPLDSLAIMVQTPPDHLTWAQLEGHAEIEPEACAAKWAEIRALARADLAAGGRLVEMLGRDTPWERARLLAIREAFVEEWQPRGGIEFALLDEAALAFHEWGEWQKRAAKLARETDGAEPYVEGWPKENGRPNAALDYEFARYETLRRREAAALQTAGQYHRAFLLTVRTLRDLRRDAGAVYIQNRGQVNVGQQQVNVQD